jgi:hypothetical protein
LLLLEFGIHFQILIIKHSRDNNNLIQILAVCCLIL